MYPHAYLCQEKFNHVTNAMPSADSSNSALADCMPGLSLFLIVRPGQPAPRKIARVTKRIRMIRKKTVLKTVAIIGCFAGVLMFQTAVAGGGTADHIETILTGPSLYLTPSALSLPLSPAIVGPGETGANAKAARAVIDACFALGARGNEASPAIGALIQKYPRAVHAQLNDNLYYSAGAGTFEDWIMTKKMGAKTRFELNAPFAAYEQLEPCSKYLKVFEEHQLLDPQYAAGKLQSARVSLKITFVFYAGACALSRITGMDLGIDRAAWQQYAPDRAGSRGRAVSNNAGATAAASASNRGGATATTSRGESAFERLLADPPIGKQIEVYMTGGSVLIGALLQLDAQGLTINIPGAAAIPVEREAIKKISTNVSPW